MTIDLAAVAAAISGTRDGLAASGHAIDCSERAGGLVFTVRALPGACAECLVPKPIFSAILRQELGDGGIRVDAFDVVYPVEGGDAPN
ncbi:MAG: hypothetical protein JNM90_25795 [Burkholderiales bacterium]|nr:hypothetical protein [Burkholderiales bacterium]